MSPAKSPQKTIAASTKHMEMMFEKLCELSSYGLFAVKTDELSTDYTEEEIEQLKQSVEEVREDQFLEEIYGNRAHLDKSEWLDKISNEVNWIFDSAKIRQRLFLSANIEQRHF